MTPGRPARRAFAAAVWSLLALGLGACSILPDYLGESEGPPLPGERISVLALERRLQPDPRLADVEVRLPRPWANPDWPQAGGYPAHAMHHLALGESLRQLWRADIGSSSGSYERIVAQPVAADGKVFAMDAEARVSAFNADNGRLIWRVDLTPKDEERGAIGGGIAYDRGRLYATSGYGEVFALDADNGAQLWGLRAGIPFRGAPTVDGGRLFAITYDNQLHAISTASGKVEWIHSGITENAGLLGGASPAVEGGIVIAPYSSGELFAVRTDSGVVAWSDQLVRAGRVSPVGTINDINARPVIDRGRVYAISHSGRMTAIDLRSGERLWDREIAGVQTPWVAGDFIYLVTLDAEVLCLSRRDGRVRWVRQLDRYLRPDSSRNKGVVSWYGPVLAGDRLVLVSSNGQAVSLSPYNGDLLGRMRLSGSAGVAPAVANGVLYLLTDDARLIAMR
jgi:outer membrane protein assembly factor BamB